jgi:hypothetical protein
MGILAPLPNRLNTLPPHWVSKCLSAFSQAYVLFAKIKKDFTILHEKKN